MSALTIDHVARQPIVILVYFAGSSGEFLAWALTESISGITKTSAHWEDNGRCKYSDALGRSLNGGNDPVLADRVVERFKLYCENNTLDKKHLALAHPDAASIDFISCHLGSLDMIEITMNSETSRQFRYIAAATKITPQDIENSGILRPWWSLEKCFSNDLVSNKINYSAPNHLKIEWEDIMLRDTTRSLDSIAQFVGGRADHTVYRSMLAEYLQRNQEIFKKI